MTQFLILGNMINYFKSKTDIMNCFFIFIEVIQEFLIRKHKANYKSTKLGIDV